MSTLETLVNEIHLEIPVSGAFLEADLVLPLEPSGLVMFAHGTGSDRFSPRNRHSAEHLNRAGFATLLMELLTTGEKQADEKSGLYRFDLQMISERMTAASQWISGYSRIPRLRIGFFGASTGAAAALVAAARMPTDIFAVVSRGGRPDLAARILPEVEAPTLLIVGEKDAGTIEPNKSAFEALKCEKRLEIVPDATHFFEEAGALAKVTDLATVWFLAHIGK